MADALLTINNVVKRFDDTTILDGISFSVKKSEVIVIVGPSGCGKSTTAGIIMGHMKNYTGNVTIGGNSLSQISEASLMKHITYVGHNSYLFKGTVRQNLLMGSA